MKTFGNTNSMQAITQTGEDNLNVSRGLKQRINLHKSLSSPLSHHQKFVLNINSINSRALLWISF